MWRFTSPGFQIFVFWALATALVLVITLLS